MVTHLERISHAMTAVRLAGILVSLVLSLWLFAHLVKAIKRRKYAVSLISEAQRFFRGVSERKALRTVGSSAVLKPSESALYSGHAKLYESRAVRHYESSGVGFRVMKGVYVGGSKGRSVSRDEIMKIDEGILTITNNRLVFDGSHQDRVIPLAKIIGAEYDVTMVEVSTEGRQKSMIFELPNSLIAGGVLKICCAVNNPLDMSTDSLSFKFEPPATYDWKVVPMVASLAIACLSAFAIWDRRPLFEAALGMRQESPRTAISTTPSIPTSTALTGVRT